MTEGAATTGRGRAFAWILLAYVLATAAALATVWYLSDWDLLLRSLAADVVATVVVFGASVAFRNSSFYDAYWSVAPPLLLLYWVVVLAPSLSLRLLALALLVCWWAVRLTHNWARGWSGLDHEDWRYVDLQQKLGVLYWPVSFLGVHLMPTLWVFAGCLGAYLVAQPAAAEVPWGIWDTLALATGVAAVALEGRADNELRAFRARRASAAELLQTGVWAWCRHPNYLGEIGFWVSVGLFGYAAAPDVWWLWLGPLAMVVLFVGITIPMQERKLRAAKPDFEAYAQRTFSLLPLSTLRS